MPFAQTIEEIRAQYPDQWVLIGNPELRDPQSLGTVLSKLVRGVVLFAMGKIRRFLFSLRNCPARVTPLPNLPLAWLEIRPVG